MANEQQPEVFKNPQEFYAEGSGRGMVIQSLGYIGLSPEAGPGIETSYYVTYFPGRATVYTRRPNADPSLPERSIMANGHIPTLGTIRDYKREGSYRGIWLEGYAAGEHLETKFVYAKPQASVDRRREEFQAALHEMNAMVRERAINDLGPKNEDRAFPEAA